MDVTNAARTNSRATSQHGRDQDLGSNPRQATKCEPSHTKGTNVCSVHISNTARVTEVAPLVAIAQGIVGACISVLQQLENDNRHCRGILTPLLGLRPSVFVGWVGGWFY
jgi:hypothetical protein